MRSKLKKYVTELVGRSTDRCTVDGAVVHAVANKPNRTGEVYRYKFDHEVLL